MPKNTIPSMPDAIVVYSTTLEWSPVSHIRESTAMIDAEGGIPHRCQKVKMRST